MKMKAVVCRVAFCECVPWFDGALSQNGKWSIDFSPRRVVLESAVSSI